MYLARIFTGLGLVLSLALTSAERVGACSCPAPGPPCQNAFQVDVVFAGTVQSVSVVPDDEPPPPAGQARIPRALRVTFVDVMTFRGGLSSTVSLTTDGATCGYRFKEGGRYLVYARAGREGLVTSICSRTRPLAEAAEDLRYLETLSKASTAGARVFGKIDYSVQDPATAEGWAHTAVPDVLVSIRGPAGAFDATTDDAGRYEVTVPPGKYEVTAVPPHLFSARYLQQAIEVRDRRGCAVANFSLRFDGRIRGTIRESSGAPAANVSVEAMAAERVAATGRIETLRTTTDAGGFYEFIELSPGRYVIGVDLVRRMDADRVFPSTFHPGTTDAALATVVQLNGGQQRDLEPMALSPPRREHRLTGHVVYEDGTPAADVSISLRDGAGTRTQVGGARTQSDGSFSLVVHEGLSYIASASQWNEATRKPMEGSVGPFVVVREDMGPLRIVLLGR